MLWNLDERGFLSQEYGNARNLDERGFISQEYDNALRSSRF